jgi:hypothetical protein
MHFPLQQASLLPHSLPQVPQFSVVRTSVQLPEQQRSSFVQWWPQFPQLSSSDLVYVQVPSHWIAPGPQAVTSPG